MVRLLDLANHIGETQGICSKYTLDSDLCFTDIRYVECPLSRVCPAVGNGLHRSVVYKRLVLFMCSSKEIGARENNHPKLFRLQAIYLTSPFAKSSPMITCLIIERVFDNFFGSLRSAAAYFSCILLNVGLDI